MAREFDYRFLQRMASADSSLVATLTDGSGRDYSKYSLTPTLVGNTNVSSRTLVFDGTGDYVTYPDSEGFSFTIAGQDQSFTMMAWIYMDAALSARRCIFFKSAEYIFELYPSSDPLYKGLAITCWKSDFSAGIIGHMNSVVGISATTWLHVCATYTGSESPTGFSLYLNGAAQSRATATFGTYAGMSNTAASIQINGAGGSYQWAGKVADPRIYSRVLSTAEIATIYSQGRP